MDANVPGKPYTHQNDRKNDTSDTDMAEARREHSKMRCGNAAMGVVVVRKNTRQVKRMTPFLNDVLAVSEAKRS